MKKVFALIGVIVIAIVSACNPSKNATAATSTASLTNTYWKLTEMNGKKVETPDNAKEVHIKFATNENKFQGFAGCNGLGGNYVLSGSNNIKITAIATRMYCDRMNVENFLTDAVTKADNYKIVGEKLSLYQGKKLLVQFDSVYF